MDIELPMQVILLGDSSSTESQLSVTLGDSLTVTVGAGGASNVAGSNSQFSTVTSYGGGNGGNGGNAVTGTWGSVVVVVHIQEMEPVPLGTTHKVEMVVMVMVLVLPQLVLVVVEVELVVMVELPVLEILVMEVMD